ncbi:MAG: sulfite exporter TauE/SafE family protein [Dehalococcoidales bacterium]|nr:sulfite exporter TauE/SafE family protein [Dehalococcoidales bacterium]
MDSVIVGLTLGIGLATSCAVLCLPILVPYIASSAKPSIIRGLYTTLAFSSGRLISYLALGLIFGLLITTVEINPVITATATLILGLLLAFHGLSVLGLFKTKSIMGSIFCRYTEGGKSLVYLGMLTGLRPCLPLIAALTYSITLASIGETLTFMLSFGFASSLLIFLIGPVSAAVLGVTSKKISVERIRRISSLALVVIGLFFTIQGIGLIIYLI